MDRSKSVTLGLLRLALVLSSALATILVAQPANAAGITYYVSKMGNNADGTSWATAWNELDQINWNVIQPGDTILLDGGATECSFPVTVTGETNTPLSSSGGDCGMVYQTTLTIEKSGQPGSPITIKLAEEPGRNGTVRIFGGRSTPVPYCGQTDYNVQIETHRGIYVEGKSYIVIDGIKWSGIMIYGHSPHGIWLQRSQDQQDIIIRNVEVFDNGINKGGRPDQEGVYPNGTRLTFERVIVHDNGQDAFQTGYQMGVTDFSLRQSWLYNQRPHPSKPDEPFNECTHSDGIQIYGGGDQYGLTVEDSIIGPGFMQGFILGDYSGSGYATIHDVTVRNTLIVHHHGASSNGGLITKTRSDKPPTNYLIDHVTVVRDPGKSWYNMLIEGTSHTVIDSVFYGGWGLRVDGSPVTSNNFNWQVPDNSNIATEADPMFVDNDFLGVGEGFADFDFTIQNPAIPPGTGSSITSVAQLLGQPEPTPTPTSTDTPTPVPTDTPIPTDTPTPTPLPGLSWQAEGGSISNPFVVSSAGGDRIYIHQLVETTDPGQGGRASYRFNITTSGGYVVKMVVDAPRTGANSVFVNIDSEPANPDMIWDIPVTQGFEESTVSWRGSGTPDTPQFAPKVFTLSAGEHELIIRGREKDTCADVISLVYLGSSPPDKAWSVFLPSIRRH